MTFTEEQMKALSVYEEHLRTAVFKRWARTPGREGIRVIWEIYTKATGDRRRLPDNCSDCILGLLQDCGKIYFLDKEILAKRETSTKEVKASQEEKEAIKKVKVKVTKKAKK